MAEPTSAYSLYDLLLRVAVAGGVAYYGSTGQERAMIPVDTHEFNKCLRIVNDGIKMFITDAPPNGWRWVNRQMEVLLAPSYTGTATAGAATTLTDSGIAATYDDDYFNTFTIGITAGTGVGETAVVTDYDGTLGKFTFAALSGGSTPDTTSEYRISRSTAVINADPARYLLDQAFAGEVTGDITFVANTNNGGRLDWISESFIRRQREMSVATGTPIYAAVRPNSTNRRWELIIDPAPTAADTLVFPYRTGFNALDALSGTATAGAATSLTDTGLIDLYPDDYFNGDTIYVIDGTGQNSRAVVTDYVGATGVFTVADWLSLGDVAGGTDAGEGSIYYVCDENKHPAGMQFDEAVLSACLAKAEMEFEDLNLGYVAKYHEKDIKRAWEADVRSAPRTLGPMLSRHSIGSRRDRYDVSYEG